MLIGGVQSAEKAEIPFRVESICKLVSRSRPTCRYIFVKRTGSNKGGSDGWTSFITTHSDKTRRKSLRREVAQRRTCPPRTRLQGGQPWKRIALIWSGRTRSRGPRKTSRKFSVISPNFSGKRYFSYRSFWKVLFSVLITGITGGRRVDGSVWRWVEVISSKLNFGVKRVNYLRKSFDRQLHFCREEWRRILNASPKGNDLL